MVEASLQAAEWIDPRVQRSRHMLHQALERLMESKSLEKISVGDIADEAALNRATFYDHYTDKFALLEGLASTRFQELLTRRNVVFDGHCPSALMGITLAMCDYLSSLPGILCPERRQLDKHFESALVAVVRGMILCGFGHNPPPKGTSPQLLAATISGAMYGGVNEWVRTPNRCPAEEVVHSIFLLISPMLRS